MLNPLAHDFTPLSAILSPEATDNVKKNSRHNKKPHDPKPTKKPVHNKQSQTKGELKSRSDTKQKDKLDIKPKDKLDTKPKEKVNKKKDSQASHSKKPNNRGQRRSSQQTSPTDLFGQEAKFITIEAAIDPVYRLDSHVTSAVSRRQSVDQRPLEHGYERYIDWIDRSLRVFDTVTVVGMDNAVVDIVSIVTILQDRNIGIHDDVETFSMDTGHSRLTSCIQVKLHPF